MLDKILYVGGNSDRPTSITTIICLPFFIYNRYDSEILPLLKQFFLTPNTIKSFMDLRTHYLTNTWNAHILNFSTGISISGALHSGTTDSAVCISACLTSLTPCIFKSWQTCLLAHTQNTLRIFYQVSYRLADLKFIYAYTQLTNAVVLAVCFKLINSVILSFCFWNSASFTSYTAHIIFTGLALTL